MIIKNWSVVTTNINPYQAPETQGRSLQGRVFGHPKFDDGTEITTSSICGIGDQGEILTTSGSSYILGQVDPAYEKKFSNAKNRLLISLGRGKL